jgi:hypothetical protein
MEQIMGGMESCYHQDDSYEFFDGEAYPTAQSPTILSGPHSSIVSLISHYIFPLLKYSALRSEDIHLTRATGGNPTEPTVYHKFFDRGIDPDIDDPTQCHEHSELPETWPALEDILTYREKVKERIMALYNDPKAISNRTIMRALWIGFEHECERMTPRRPNARLIVIQASISRHSCT